MLGGVEAYFKCVRRGAFFICAAEEVAPAEGLEYSLSEDGSYYIVYEMGSCIRKRFIIPESYNGKPVKAVAEAAFYEKNIIKVVLPDSIERIEASAFCNCKSLKEVVFGSGLQTIGNKSFYDCSNLKDLTIPNSVTSIGDGAFKGCGELTSVTIGSGVTSIGNSAFAYCNKIKEIHYNGTKEEWLAIEKSGSWNEATGYSYTIYCTDGEI